MKDSERIEDCLELVGTRDRVCMASIIAFITRNWQIYSPSELPKEPNALKFGILGAAKIAPSALIKPAKTHPEVIIQAVAARNKQKAIDYAKKHGIPQVHDSYEGTFFPHFPSEPTWQFFLSLIDRPNLERAVSVAKLPSYIISKNSIQFKYELGGGNMLDLGTYVMGVLRDVMGAEPEECTKCTVRRSPPPNELCDEAADATFRFPGDLIGEAVMDMRASVSTLPTFKVTVIHKARESKKIYTFKDAGIDEPSELSWISYRHQLEQFVNRIRGREGSGLWVRNEDSLAQAKMIDMAYEKSGLPLRPTSKFVRLEAST
ncbi:uncharacterized protein CDV56_105587 [Aspergillus thermomutatus]|uniref:GFO/IDH/MocA-like oxidoreductase domain-containing protein n=1 Tax=Aspergillus thermomutatus TaxID=41047 RepID=A0A397GJ97_ASPTH|nr:uncharacterized protein CDV56_105587 [Aspergillus thermomutatus]RHZ49506.1 hypothetical protein CDV56_105587 [Aspergillus thermomutatus]